MASDDAHDGLIAREEVLASPVSGLVVLAACGTHRGPERWGNDRLANLGGAFLEAGARAIVGSRYEIELNLTLELLAAFYRELAAGVPPAEALRRSRVALGAGRDLALRLRLAQLRVLGLGQEPVLD